MCFDFQIFLDFRVAGLHEIAQVDLTWHYFNRVWLKFIQFLRWGKRKAAINIPQGRNYSLLGFLLLFCFFFWFVFLSLKMWLSKRAWKDNPRQ